ncbi:hypothetical protein OS493_002299 [Desmophyllum pertusum]|uniref:Uncharacterized protein n=1 Tax=Desmophyllum pertusum TaxID=174260 RepID=A0A9W9YST5_9CNID|nr:hypothetical protein OS493_002299 [Desmophyllum pertusum]
MLLTSSEVLSCGILIQDQVILHKVLLIAEYPVSRNAFRELENLQEFSPQQQIGLVNVQFTTATSTCVNSVHTPLASPSSNVLFNAAGSGPQQQIGRLNVQFLSNDSCISDMAPIVHQPLLSPRRVSPIKVDRLRKEVSAHPDQPFAEYVFGGDS